MSATRDALLAALDAYVDPLIGRGLLACGAVKRAEVTGGRAQIELELGFPAAGYRHALAGSVAQAVRAATGLDADVAIGWRIESHAVQKNLKPLAQIRNIIAVASGKGGVGKSTVAVNLALALHAEGARVGILDADIYGPSQPRMLGSRDKPTSPDGKHMNPIVAHGLQAMSIGFLVDEEQPMIWRGPMVTQALGQLLAETLWRDLDYLIVDLPPGTGDIQLSLAQRIPVSGALIVTTPQDIALLDARKGLQMFRKVEVPVLGIIENMAWHVCTHCGHREPIFGEGGGAQLAQQYGVELLGQLPLDMRIREQADGGCPTVVAAPESDLAQRYRDIARRAAARLAYGVQAPDFPAIEISDD
ncbi:ATP-binding protein involved in chromosome partitioning [Fontimonas thermophila]|uniref:Iron-sulfur cluster carrier protein n=1 Tax=Fontimonas thermophila TaxID=1076937 RepID=A0A1I2IPF1_9GAMM|nr:iron-sulfur cluster carrier protein ApbC [Fontimonas thermophila]SFF42391.1 ATP-binding protein involved in chromosome partitioning [Fontimonas thermophila]